MEKGLIAISACLVGKECKYNGEDTTNSSMQALMQFGQVVSVCPEAMGGLGTPRPKIEIKDGRAITKNGEDFTEQLQKGAQKVLEICQKYDIEEAILNSKSPSCGYGEIYSGDFDGTLVPGNGVTANLLEDNGIKITSSDNFVKDNLDDV